MLVLSVGAVLLSARAGLCEPNRAKVIADFEGETKFSTDGATAKPATFVTSLTASQGRRSLRFVYSGEGADRATIGFPVPDGAQGFNAVAFDLYCEKNNGSSLVVSLRQEVTEPGKAARYTAAVNLSDVMGGWNPVRFVLGAGLVFKQDGGVEPDWSRIRSINLTVAGNMKGEVAYYLDNLRFEAVSARKVMPNLLYNSSFELAANPDVPDGWTRDLNAPPFGQAAWGIDASAAHHGAKSLRIGCRDKYARSWGRHTRIAQGKEYTFSVYLKAAAEGTKAELSVTGVGGKRVDVGTEWSRHWLTGKASSTDTAAYVWLRSDGALWVDAAQLEPGSTPTEYAPSAADSVSPEDTVEKRQTIADPGIKVPSVRIARAARPPAIDGDLTDSCWQAAAEMTPFVKLAADEPASRKTVARMCYDDSALYFAVRAEDPDMKAVADLLDKSQANPWATDHIELFIDLSHDHNSYYQFVANAKGQRWQARHTTKALFAQPPDSWRCEWTAAGKTDAQGWTLEVAIPYTCFDLRPQIQVGDVLGVNICRDDPRTKDPSAWAFGYGAFHTPQAFGDVTGFAADLKPYRFELQSIAWRQGSVQAAMRNHTGADAHVKAVFTAHLAEGRRQQAEAAITSSAGRDCDAAAAMPLREDGTHQVSLQLVDPKGRVRFASQPTEVRILGQSILDLVGAEFDFYTKETDARVRCFVEASKARCETLTLSCWLEQDGRRLGEPSARRPTPGVNEWPMRIADLAHGAYVLKAALVERGQPLIEKAKTFRKLPPAKHEVRISQWGRYLVCDGEPVFWYGFYDNLSRGDDERWVEALKLMQGANCNAVLNYIGGKAEHEKVGWALDQAHAHGIKMWVHLGWMLSYWIEKYKGRTDRYANDEEAIAALRQQVLKHKDHPALLGWCTLDEPGNRPTLFTKEYTEKHYRLIKELDPHHPCMFSHLTRVGESSIYGGATDLALIPFLERGGRYDQLFWEFWDAGLPLAANSPCFGALGSACREPTPSEQRVRMYKSLILGARGLCIYTFRCASVKTWDEIAQVGRELRQLAPVLLTPDDRLRVDVTTGGEDVLALLKAFKGKHLLLAVNAGPKPVDAVFRLVDAPSIGKLTPLFATPPPTQIDPAAKTLHVRLSAQSTAIYDIAPVER